MKPIAEIRIACVEPSGSADGVYHYSIKHAGSVIVRSSRVVGTREQAYREAVHHAESLGFGVLAFTREQAVRLVWSYTAAITTPEGQAIADRIADRMVERGECVWHACARVTERRCHCTPCVRARDKALQLERELLWSVQQGRGLLELEPGANLEGVVWRAARKLRLVRAVLGIEVGAWLRALRAPRESLRVDWGQDGNVWAGWRP